MGRRADKPKVLLLLLNCERENKRKDQKNLLWWFLCSQLGRDRTAQKKERVSGHTFGIIFPIPLNHLGRKRPVRAPSPILPPALPTSPSATSTVTSVIPPAPFFCLHEGIKTMFQCVASIQGLGKMLFKAFPNPSHAMTPWFWSRDALGVSPRGQNSPQPCGLPQGCDIWGSPALGVFPPRC